MSTPAITMKGYEIIAIYDQTNEEKRMCLRAKQDAIKRGRKCFVNIPASGPHKNMLCLWMHKEHIAKGESPTNAGKKKYQAGPVVLIGERGKHNRSQTSFQKQ